MFLGYPQIRPLWSLAAIVTVLDGIHVYIYISKQLYIRATKPYKLEKNNV